MCALGPPVHALDSGPLGRIGLGWALGVDRMCQSGIGSGWVMMDERDEACLLALQYRARLKGGPQVA